MALKLANRCGIVTQSEIRQMSIECEKVDGINMSQGVCEMPVPRIVADGAREAINAGLNSYTRYDGIRELRTAIAKKSKDYNGITADPDSEIIVSGGSTGAFYSACLALLDPGDEVILFEPYYGYHRITLEAAQGVATYVRLRLPDWTFTEEDLERAWTPRTRGIMVNTPANPSGKVFTAAELAMIQKFAEKHDIFIFTDEIYEYIVYDGRRHISPGSLPGAGARTITISGYSKTFSVTGWRVGYSICDAKWARMIGYMSDLVYVCAPSPLQAGVAKGISSLDPSHYTKLRDSLFAKRKLVCDALTKAGLTPHIPQGAYYILADISRLPGKTGKERAMGLLAKSKVACVPGEAFFHEPAQGYGLGRFCFALSDDETAEACRRLESL
jgi:aminotransferase